MAVAGALGTQRHQGALTPTALTFTYDALPSRVIFGVGSLKGLPAEMDRLGVRRVLILASPSQRPVVETITQALGDQVMDVYETTGQHVPLASAEQARRAAGGADGCLAVGGGSPIGLAKAVALTTSLPILAVPTTYSGSEMTPIWGLTEGGRKTTGRDRRVLPHTVLYDPALTLSLPPNLSATSGINALAHCVEALYAPDTNPIVTLMAEEGVRALAQTLPLVVREPGHLEGRTGALYGAWLAGVSLGAVSMGLHHKLCHTLGGAYGLPHAELHTVVLPHAVRYNQAAAPKAMARLAAALGVADPAQGLFDLAQSMGVQMSLRELGLRETDLDPAADLATRSPYPNPAPLTRDGIRRLLDDAFHGRRPA